MSNSLKWVKYVLVSTHSRPKAAASIFSVLITFIKFQHTAARRRLDRKDGFLSIDSVSTHSRPKAAELTFDQLILEFPVSTHSRPKAAGPLRNTHSTFCHSFNTQPPEGGWLPLPIQPLQIRLFQHTAARRRLAFSALASASSLKFQHTAARRRLACLSFKKTLKKSFNTQPPEGGWTMTLGQVEQVEVSTHSRPKAAVARGKELLAKIGVSTHSRPKAAGAYRPERFDNLLFQHTAARRRLDHGRSRLGNHQLFQHTAARRRLAQCVTKS